MRYGFHLAPVLEHYSLHGADGSCFYAELQHAAGCLYIQKLGPRHLIIDGLADRDVSDLSPEVSFLYLCLDGLASASRFCHRLRNSFSREDIRELPVVKLFQPVARLDAKARLVEDGHVVRSKVLRSYIHVEAAGYLAEVYDPARFLFVERIVFRLHAAGITREHICHEVCRGCLCIVLNKSI